MAGWSWFAEVLGVKTVLDGRDEVVVMGTSGGGALWEYVRATLRREDASETLAPSIYLVGLAIFRHLLDTIVDS
jgi:hypothetical protein